MSIPIPTQARQSTQAAIRSCKATVNITMPTRRPASQYATPIQEIFSEFRGHSAVTETWPDGRKTTTYYYQDDAKKGRDGYTVTKDANGTLLNQVNYGYDGGAGAHRRVLATSQLKGYWVALAAGKTGPLQRPELELPAQPASNMPTTRQPCKAAAVHSAT